MLPVIINSGSGNQGMTCSLPVIEFGKELKKSKEEIYRALCVSNLVALNQKKYDRFSLQRTAEQYVLRQEQGQGLHIYAAEHWNRLKTQLSIR